MRCGKNIIFAELCVVDSRCRLQLEAVMALTFFDGCFWPIAERNPVIAGMQNRLRPDLTTGLSQYRRARGCQTDRG
jgi:hypothetical protein